MRGFARIIAPFLLLLPIGAASAEGAGGAVTGRAVSGAGRQIVEAGLARLAPAIIARARGAYGETGKRLTERLAGRLGAELAAAWGGRFALVGRGGLEPAGEALLRFVAKARFHGLELALPAVAASPGPAAAPEIAPEVLLGAWREAAGQGAARLDAAAEVLLRRVPGLSPEQGGDDDARISAEVALAEALADLVARLPARPRAEAVLADEEHGYYLSPDVVWRGAPDPVATAEALGAALAAAREGRLEAHLLSLAPAHSQYRGLTAAAERYAAICEAGEWAPLAVPKNEKEARSPELVSALQARLAREGFFSGAPTGQWDDATRAAVLEARRTRHLKDKSPDYDRDLVRVLAVPCSERLATLLLNLKRWRHSAWNGEAESVQVNLAGQILRYYRGGEIVMAQRTVVGSDKGFFSKFLNRKRFPNATPILHDTIDTVIVNPEWNVPPRIARDELQPEIDKDPGYVEKHGFTVRQGGDGANYFVQAPGPGNALGRIKILFPNSESVYLHDTPGRAAFKLPVRALSHGCVRVDNALDLGAELVRADRDKDGIPYDPATLKGIVANSRKTFPFTLAHPVPVFLEYYTASVDEAGAVWFHPDIYGYDAETLSPAVATP